MREPTLKLLVSQPETKGARLGSKVDRGGVEGGSVVSGVSRGWLLPYYSVPVDTFVDQDEKDAYDNESYGPVENAGSGRLWRCSIGSTIWKKHRMTHLLPDKSAPIKVTGGFITPSPQQILNFVTPIESLSIF